MYFSQGCLSDATGIGVIVEHLCEPKLILVVNCDLRLSITYLALILFVVIKCCCKLINSLVIVLTSPINCEDIRLRNLFTAVRASASPVGKSCIEALLARKVTASQDHFVFTVFASPTHHLGTPFFILHIDVLYISSHSGRCSNTTHLLLLASAILEASFKVISFIFDLIVLVTVAIT